MSTPLVDPSIAQNTLTDHQVKTMRREADSARQTLNGSPATAAAKEKKLREACEGFEAIFLQKIWEGMRASLPKEGLMHSREEQFWQGMYDQELGKSLASNGGIGLADMMMSQLSRNLQSASEVAASRNGRVPMDIDPVPLLPTSPAASGSSEKPVASGTGEKGSGLYEGEAAQPSAPTPETSQAAAAPQAPAQAQVQAQANDPSASIPPEILGPLNEFAARLGVSPVGGAAVPVGQAGQAAERVEPGVAVFRQGQKPTQSVDELAAALVAQAAQENGGAVRVTTVRQVNSANPPSRPHPVVRQSRTAPTVATGSPVTGRGGLAPVEQTQQLVPAASSRNRMAAAAAGSAAMASAAGAPAERPSPTAGTAPSAGPSALRTSVEGLGGSGSEIATNLTAAQGVNSRNPYGTADE